MERKRAGEHSDNQINIQVRDNMLLSLKMTDELKKKKIYRINIKKTRQCLNEKHFTVMDDDDIVVLKKNTFSFFFLCCPAKLLHF